MSTPGALGARLARAAVTASILLLPAAGLHARGESDPVPTQIEGTGTFDSQVTRTTQILDPPCVSLVTRLGHVAFAGVISSALADGTLEGTALRDACASAVQGTTHQTYDLLRATVNGRTGHLRIEARGVFEGDAATPPGARTRYDLTIVGLGGDLAGVEGEGQTVGFATGFPGQPAASSSTYLVRIRFK